MNDDCIPNYIRWIELSTREIHSWKCIDNINWIDVTNAINVVKIKSYGYLNNIYGVFLTSSNNNYHYFFSIYGSRLVFLLSQDNQYRKFGKILFKERTSCNPDKKTYNCLIM